MTIRYTPEAVRDLQELRRYISKTLSNPKAAVRITQGILDSCARLKQHPQLGMSLEAKIGTSTDLRYLICEKHIAFYRIDSDTISVARIIDGRQDYLRILFSNEDM
ncbi:MAG: type II toxin-antitoxin system RelE/ParE family toxin [Oscillospiraceae bacterium]|nr:type II toxin-antitoxin system RelE/ParE family toxin [Oscillospiraceae bacterium]